MRKIVSNSIKSAIILLLPLIKTGIWDTLKKVVFSSFFRIVLEGVAFLGGFPPEQPTFFHSYMKDVFHTRYDFFLVQDAEYYVILCYHLSLRHDTLYYNILYLDV